MDYGFRQGLAMQALADARNLRLALRALKRRGAVLARAEYDGFGDSGQIEAVEIEGGECDDARIGCWAVESERTGEGDAERLVHRLRRTRKSLRDVVEDAMYRHLESLHGGWENNEGAFGTLVLSVESGTLSIEHNSRYVAYDETVTNIPVHERAALAGGH
jgi:hypothetical protein